MEETLKRLIEFKNKRNWKHEDEKDLAISIALEASELLEIFQWRSSKDAIEIEEKHIEEEIADIMIYCLFLCIKLEIDPLEIINNKMILNGKKYPVE